MFFSVNGPLNAQKAFLTQSDHECFLGVKRALQGTKSFPVKPEFVNPDNPPNSETPHFHERLQTVLRKELSLHANTSLMLVIHDVQW